MAQAQSYENHARYDPLFHYTLLPILVLNLVFAILYAVKHHAQHVHLSIWWIVLSLTFILMAGRARGAALQVQDRVIRLEEKLRLSQLASPSELAELDSLTIDQYIGLRFASNPEVVELARRAVREKLTRKQIKQNVKSWRADNDRA